MKTKDKIKIKATELFNNKGFKNVTLREVAKALGISYGNVTYHFKTKKEVIKDEDGFEEESETLTIVALKELE